MKTNEKKNRQIYQHLVSQLSQGSGLMMGYPGNLKFDYSEIFEFLGYHINNAGDRHKLGINRMRLCLQLTVSMQSIVTREIMRSVKYRNKLDINKYEAEPPHYRSQAGAWERGMTEIISRKNYNRNQTKTVE
jgi:hypothetical protein